MIARARSTRGCGQASALSLRTGRAGSPPHPLRPALLTAGKATATQARARMPYQDPCARRWYSSLLEVRRLPGDGEGQLLVSRSPPDADGDLAGVAGQGDGAVQAAGGPDGMASHRHDHIARPQPGGCRRAARIHVVDGHYGGRAMRLRCFFFNDTATTEIYTLSLHDALPI